MHVLQMTCAMCGKEFEVEMTDFEYSQYVAGVCRMQDIFPDKSVMYRESLISRMCYNCLSELYNIPKPDDDWGELLGRCVHCGCRVYGKDNGVCPKCGGEYE